MVQLRRVRVWNVEGEVEAAVRQEDEADELVVEGYLDLYREAEWWLRTGEA